MTTKQVFTVGGAGLFAAVIFSISSSYYRPATQGAIVDRSGLNQLSIHSTKVDQPKETAQLTTLAVTNPQQGMARFALIEEKFAQLTPDQARQEVRRIDDEAHKVSLKNFDDFSADERVAFLNRQREKVVLLNKIILARLERTQK